MAKKKTEEMAIGLLDPETEQALKAWPMFKAWKEAQAEFVRAEETAKKAQVAAEVAEEILVAMENAKDRAWEKVLEWAGDHNGA